MKSYSTVPTSAWYHRLDGLFMFNTWLVAGLMALLYLLLAYYNNTFIVSNELYYRTYSEQLTMERIDTLLSAQQRWLWLGYAMVPLLFAIRTSFTACCLYLGGFLLDKKIRYGAVYKVVLLAEVPLLAAACVKIIWFVFFREAQVLSDIQLFSPFSLASLVGVQHVSSYFVYPLITLNLFEVLNWLVLAVGMAYYLRENLQQTIPFVLKTYGIGLFTWMLLVIFLQLQLS
ncbi:hypothetical protein [Chitinophaga sp.]|uniref:hypothetical protein n=1 Tax=Chitinophaga sp. TaxID=1869181 RepID=UPI0031CF492F